jgi:RNase P/RNase MRP subunit p29
MDNKTDVVEESTEKKKVYPIETTDGYVYTSESDEAFGIETKVYENGNETKRITLSDKRIAIVRELKGFEIESADRLHEHKQHLYLPALASLSVTIDGKPILMEDFQQTKGKDYNKIRTAVALLNF